MRCIEKYVVEADLEESLLTFSPLDIIAVAAGLIDGLGWGSNSKGKTSASILSKPEAIFSCYNAYRGE